MRYSLAAVDAAAGVGGVRVGGNSRSVTTNTPSPATTGEPRLGFLIADAGEVEREARFRELRALSLLYFGREHPISAALGEAIADPGATERALGLLDAAPALTRRRLLASYGTLMPGSFAPRRPR
jgi:hypothetical protein